PLERLAGRGSGRRAVRKVVLHVLHLASCRRWTTKKEPGTSSPEAPLPRRRLRRRRLLRTLAAAADGDQERNDTGVHLHQQQVYSCAGLAPGRPLLLLLGSGPDV